MIRIDVTSDTPIQFKCKTSDTFLFDGFDFFSDTAKTIPLDISADTFLMKVLDSDGEDVLTLSGGTNFIVSGADDNHLSITASNTVMDLTPTPEGNAHTYFIEWTQTSTGKVRTFATGPFIIEQKDKNG